MGSGLERIDNFNDTINPVAYLSTPISIGFRQPISGYNSFRWEKKIEPLKYEEARKDYIDAMENVSMRAVTNFLILCWRRLILRLARLIMPVMTLCLKLHGAAIIGTIAENELLQMELALLNAGLP